MSGKQLRRPLTAAIAVAVCLAIWDALVHGPLADGPFPTVEATAGKLAALLGAGTFWGPLGQTVLAAVIGLAVALAAGVSLGVLLGSFDSVYRSTRFVVEFLKPIPPIVLMPLVLLLLGPSGSMGVFLVFFGCVWPILIQTIAGVHDADPVLLDTARSFGFGRFTRMTRVVLPAAAAFIVTGVRISGAAALVIAVVSELVGGAPGIGHSLYLAENAGLYADIYALVIVTGAMGVIFNGALRRVEKWMLHWHPSVRGGVIA